MNIFEFEAHARATIPVHTDSLIITQKLHTGLPGVPPSITWTVSHFAPGSYSICHQGEGGTPEGALANLITELRPCKPSEPSASATTIQPTDAGSPSIASPDAVAPTTSPAIAS